MRSQMQAFNITQLNFWHVITNTHTLTQELLINKWNYSAPSQKFEYVFYNTIILVIRFLEEFLEYVTMDFSKYFLK